jgi:hypothetical protein
MMIEALIKVTVYFIGYLVAMFIGARMVTYILSKLELNDEQRKTFSGIKGAGKIIGILERVLTITFIYMNAPTAIALIFAAKSIIRFESAKDRPFAEYYLIGTISSITFAILIGASFMYISEIAVSPFIRPI